MYDFDDVYDRESFSHDAAVTQALVKTEKGLFDTDEAKDEDVAKIYEY